MNSRTTRKFWRLFGDLPADVQERARRSYRMWRADAGHPSLHFKRVDDADPIYSVRIGLQHRALCILDGDTAIWFWIGLHDEYERQMKS